MLDLRSAFEDAGYVDVATYLASGNVIVTSSTRPSRSKVSSIVLDRFEFDSDAFVRSRSEVRSVLDRVPWDPEKSKVEVSFLSAMPTRAAARELEATAVPPEKLLVSEHEVFISRVGGGVESSHEEATTMRILDQRTTRRGLRTVQGIYDGFLQD